MDIPDMSSRYFLLVATAVSITLGLFLMFGGLKYLLLLDGASVSILGGAQFILLIGLLIIAGQALGRVHPYLLLVGGGIALFGLVGTFGTEGGKAGAMLLYGMGAYIARPGVQILYSLL